MRLRVKNIKEDPLFILWFLISNMGILSAEVELGTYVCKNKEYFHKSEISMARNKLMFVIWVLFPCGPINIIFNFINAFLRVLILLIVCSLTNTLLKQKLVAITLFI